MILFAHALFSVFFPERKTQDGWLLFLSCPYLTQTPTSFSFLGVWFLGLVVSQDKWEHLASDLVPFSDGRAVNWAALRRKSDGKTLLAAWPWPGLLGPPSSAL